MSNDVTMIGNNCGNCKRGSLSMLTAECLKCALIEKEESKKFTQWEAK